VTLKTIRTKPTVEKTLKQENWPELKRSKTLQSIYVEQTKCLPSKHKVTWLKFTWPREHSARILLHEKLKQVSSSSFIETFSNLRRRNTIVTGGANNIFSEENVDKRGQFPSFFCTRNVWQRFKSDFSQTESSKLWDTVCSLVADSTTGQQETRGNRAKERVILNSSRINIGTLSYIYERGPKCYWIMHDNAQNYLANNFYAKTEG